MQVEQIQINIGDTFICIKSDKVIKDVILDIQPVFILDEANQVVKKVFKVMDSTGAWYTLNEIDICKYTPVNKFLNNFKDKLQFN